MICFYLGSRSELKNPEPSMKPLQAALLAGIAASMTTGAIEALLANVENDFFQFCTTKAYGWPTPWKIDYCECEGTKTVYPTMNKIVNLGSIAGAGIAGFVILGGASFMRQRRN